MLEFILLTTIVWLLIWCMEIHNRQAENPLTILENLALVHGNVVKRERKERPWKYAVAAPWKLPYFLSASRPNASKDLKRANKYLKHMQRKLVYNLNNPSKSDAGDRVVDTLLSRSKAYLIMGLIKADNKYYFNKTFLKLMEIISDVRKKLRTKSIDLKVERHYMAKAVEITWSNGEVENLKYSDYLLKYPDPKGTNSGYWEIEGNFESHSGLGKVSVTKWRPIGAPDESSKIILAMITPIINEYNFIHIPDYQHGFRPNKGVSTACGRIRELLLSGQYPYIYEFDLKAFFNSVNYYFTVMKFAQKSGLLGLAVWIELLNTYLIPDYAKSGIKKESEIYWERENEVLCKSGFTQGSPLSPPMSMIGLEESGLPALINEGSDSELVMYADDGLWFTATEISKEDFGYLFDYTSRINSGVLIAKDKYFGQVSRQFKYLGCIWDLDELNVTTKDGTFDLRQVDLNWNKIFSQGDYFERNEKMKPEEWYWRIVDDSLTDKMWDKWHRFNKGLMSLVKFTFPIVRNMGRLLSFSGYVMTIWDPKASKSWRFYATYKKGVVQKWGFVNTLSASSLAAETMLRVLKEMEDRSGIIELGNNTFRDIIWYERHLIDRRRILDRNGFGWDYGMKGVMRYYSYNSPEYLRLNKQKNRPPWEYQWLHPWAYSYDQTGPQESSAESERM